MYRTRKTCSHILFCWAFFLLKLLIKKSFYFLQQNDSVNAYILQNARLFWSSKFSKQRRIFWYSDTSGIIFRSKWNGFSPKMSAEKNSMEPDLPANSQNALYLLWVGVWAKNLETILSHKETKWPHLVTMQWRYKNSFLLNDFRDTLYLTKDYINLR